MSRKIKRSVFLRSLNDETWRNVFYQRGFFCAVYTIQAKLLHQYVISGLQCNWADLLVSSHIYICHKRLFSVAWAAFCLIGCVNRWPHYRELQVEGLPDVMECPDILPFVYSFIHKLWHVGIKASASLLSAHVKSITANQQVPSSPQLVWRSICVCACSSFFFLFFDLRDSTWVLSKQILDLRPAALLSGCFYQI